MALSTERITELKQTHPILEYIMQLNPVRWINPNLRSINDIQSTGLSITDMQEAEKRLQRFAPFLMDVFPELEAEKGTIESPIKHIPMMQEKLSEMAGKTFPGSFYLKCDHQLPVAGSIKARGGFYEVLHHAENLAITAGKITLEDDYKVFASSEMKAFFSQYTIGVASTGNLGLSIGIMSAKLGFMTEVFMSRDAKQWKKDLLRQKGAHVHEIEGDFSHAVPIGRERIEQMEQGYFVDDEDSMDLFMGYATAAFRLKKQLEDEDITVDQDHPLFLYLPCGVGGSPGGITFGMKHVFGDAVHCFYAEPVTEPSVLTGLVTQYMSDISVRDIGINQLTEADGLAVSRPSRFATEISDELTSGIYTVTDDALFELLTMLVDTEHIHLEPSAAAGLAGAEQIIRTDYIERFNIAPEMITHMAWATGGNLVPEAEKAQFYKRGKELLSGGKH